MPQQEIKYIATKVTVEIMEMLYPFLAAEAERRDLTIAALISQILNEDLGRKRNQSRRTKDARPPRDRASAVKL